MKVTNPTFEANLNSPRLKLKREDFYVRIRGYGQNTFWADDIIKTTDEAVSLINKETSAENVLKCIAIGVLRANQTLTDLQKHFHTGLLRIKRDGWMEPSEWSKFRLTTPYDKNRYKVYRERLDLIAGNPLDNPYSDIDLTRPVVTKKEHYLNHGSRKFLENALNKIFKISEEYMKTYKADTISRNDMWNVNNLISELRWILAHATPWERGSDSISNVFMRALYKSRGIKVYPLKRGISLDLEAYCTNLKDYKNKFSDYFNKPPEIVE